MAKSKGKVELQVSFVFYFVTFAVFEGRHCFLWRFTYPSFLKHRTPNACRNTVSSPDEFYFFVLEQLLISDEFLLGCKSQQKVDSFCVINIDLP